MFGSAYYYDEADLEYEIQVEIHVDSKVRCRGIHRKGSSRTHGGRCLMFFLKVMAWFLEELTRPNQRVKYLLEYVERYVEYKSY